MRPTSLTPALAFLITAMPVHGQAPPPDETSVPPESTETDDPALMAGEAAEADAEAKAKQEEKALEESATTNSKELIGEKLGPVVVPKALRGEIIPGVDEESLSPEPAGPQAESPQNPPIQTQPAQAPTSTPPEPSLALPEAQPSEPPPPPEQSTSGGKTTIARADQQGGPAGWMEQFLGNGAQPKFTIGIAGGYSLRMHDDDRTHGAGLFGFTDIPLAYGFGAQVSAWGNGWLPSEKAPDPLGLVGAAGSLIYAFDDTDAVAWLGVGPAVAAGVVFENGSPSFIPHAGALLSFGVRFKLGEATRAEVAVRAPVFFWDQTNGVNVNLPIGTNQATNPSSSLFPTQIFMTAGINFEPFGFMDAMENHGSITKALMPTWLMFGRGANADAKKDDSPERAGGDKESTQDAPQSAPPDEGEIK